jgi:hypothetical protein
MMRIGDRCSPSWRGRHEILGRVDQAHVQQARLQLAKVRHCVVGVFQRYQQAPGVHEKVIDIAGGVSRSVSAGCAILLYFATSTNTWSCRNVICVRQDFLKSKESKSDFL